MLYADQLKMHIFISIKKEKRRKSLLNIRESFDSNQEAAKYFKKILMGAKS
jgi:hypothetical protein